jgi:hypothetical protein
VADSERRDFFVSHAGADRAWALWVTWHLRGAGFTVVLDATDWASGMSFVRGMDHALKHCDRVVVLLSQAYLDATFTQHEFQALLAQPVTVVQRQLVLLRVGDVEPPPLLRAYIYTDLFDLGEEQAAAALSAALRPSGPSLEPPHLPGASTASRPRWPGALPALWNVPARSSTFIGRRERLAQLRELLTTTGRSAVHAVHGTGGVGKTQLAIEYAHRHADEYDLVWWVNAQQPSLIPEQFAALAFRAGVATVGTDVPSAVEAAQALLRSRGRWLMVLDNVPRREDIASWVPQGPGHVIITSRSPAWYGVAATIELDVFTRAESVALLQAAVTGIAEHEADGIAAALGHLPLALAQAISVMTADAMPAAEYLQLVGTSIARLAAAGTPAGYPASLAASVGLALDRLDVEDHAVGQLMRVCAWLGPEPIPVWLLAEGATAMPAQLQQVVRDGLGLRQAIGAGTGYGLIRSTGDSVTMHRLTQAVIRADRTPPPYGRDLIESVLVAARPGDAGDPAVWPRWGDLLPHILATDPATTDNPDMMWLVDEAVWHMHARGDYVTAFTVVQALHQAWRQRYGPDHRSVLSTAQNLAVILVELGDYQTARPLLEDGLVRSRRVLGDDHPGVLGSASNLAVALRELGLLEEARALDEDTLTRKRRVLGDDHPSTFGTAGNLSNDLTELGLHEQARALNEDTLARKRQVLGDDHPSTVASANNLAVNLRELGLVEQARALNEDTLARRRRVLGDDHPDTLGSAGNLAVDLRGLGLYEQARALDEDTLTRRRRVLGDDHPDTLGSAGNLAIDLLPLRSHDHASETTSSPAQAPDEGRGPVARKRRRWWWRG